MRSSAKICGLKLLLVSQVLDRALDFLPVGSLRIKCQILFQLVGGFLLLDRTKFRASFAADVSADSAAFMADSQVPWGLDALNGAVTEPAWKTKPSWHLVSTEDKMIPPDAQRAMSKRAGSTVVEAKGSHAVYVSQPGAVADLIAKAANGVALATR